jgi:chromosome segregation ATPase
VKLLESQLEDEKLRVYDLESENRLINQKIIQLEGQITDLQNNGMTDDEQMQTFQEIIKQKEIMLESTKIELNDAQLLITNLKEIIAKKDEELSEKDEQYKKYVNKAKVTLDHLTGSVASSGSISSSSDQSTIHSNDANYFKQLLMQKELECNKLKTDYDNSISFREMEERLMTIAFHNLVIYYFI